MATIHMGPDILSLVCTRSEGFGSTGTLRIYKGTIIDVNNATSAISSRSSDLLLTFTNVTIPSSSTGFSYLEAGSVNARRRQSFGINSTEIAASASGIASWFAYMISTSVIFIGSVGPTGSSADLQIGTTEIVAGETYTSLGFFIDFPSTYYF